MATAAEIREILICPMVTYERKANSTIKNPGCYGWLAPVAIGGETVSLLTLSMMGEVLFIFRRPSYFDFQQELLTGDTKVVDATLDVPPERILMNCGTEGILAGKMMIHPGDDLQDISRYVLLPSLSMAKECEDYLKEFCHQKSDLEAYRLSFTDNFQHDFFTFEGRLAYEREKSYIIKAYRYLDEQVSSFALGRRRREYSMELAKKEKVKSTAFMIFGVSGYVLD